MVKNNIVVVKNVPLPKRNAKYPWGAMRVGDSFSITKDIAYARSLAYNAPRLVKTCRGKKFVAGVHGGKVRVWRVK